MHCNNTWLEEFSRKQSVTVIPNVHIIATWSFMLLVGSRIKVPHSKCLRYQVLDKNALSHAKQKTVYRVGAKPGVAKRD